MEISHYATQVLASSHWLPIAERIEFKVNFLTFKALSMLFHQISLAVRTAEFLYSGHLRSSERTNCLRVIIFRSPPQHFFSSSAPRLLRTIMQHDFWAIYAHIWPTTCLLSTKHQLETHLYTTAFTWYHVKWLSNSKTAISLIFPLMLKLHLCD